MCVSTCSSHRGWYFYSRQPDKVYLANRDTHGVTPNQIYIDSWYLNIQCLKSYIKQYTHAFFTWMVYLQTPRVFHSLMVLSLEPETIWRLSWEKATLRTSLVCPTKRLVVFPLQWTNNYFIYFLFQNTQQEKFTPIKRYFVMTVLVWVSGSTTFKLARG